MSEQTQIQFLLNRRMVSVSLENTHLTLLQYLRENAHLTGAKEGCAEGDCGACTVVIGQLKQDTVTYKAVNACILLLAQIHGCEVVTVEGLQDEAGALHPVQQALVDFHGSQCGFCTPGFVMSLYAHYQNNLPNDRQSLKDALAGNLCRCTGYGPILAAGQAMYEYAKPKQNNTYSILCEISKNKALTDTTNQLLFAPDSETELQNLLIKYPDAILWAGGTDSGLWITKQLQHLPVIIVLGNIQTLDFIKETKDGIEIGSMCCYADAIDILGRYWPALGEVMRRIGSTQIRNSGTLGGNIANGSPIGDMAPMLIALGAKLILQNGQKARQIMLEDFFVAYGKQDLRDNEYVARIFIPRAAQKMQLAAWKVSKRFDQDISAVLGAFAFQKKQGKIIQTAIAFGGMAATPKRAKQTETILLAKQDIEPAMLALATDFTPLDDMRASGTYRLHVAQALLKKAFLDETPTYLANAEADDEPV